MRINHNLEAMNTQRQLSISQGKNAKSMEKLSSGLRINRAGDDAAGLAISEKMRAQVRGLNQASRNAQDGISLIQTAEGALEETHDILQRMRELSIQSANGTLEEGVDRVNLTKEFTRLKEEIDRISESTEFNGIKVLDGTLSEQGSAQANGHVLGAASVIGGRNTINATNFTIRGVTSDQVSNGDTVEITGPATTALNDMKFRFELGTKTENPSAYVDTDKGEIVIRLSADQTLNVEAGATGLDAAINSAITNSNLVYTPDGGTTYYYTATGDEFANDNSDFDFSVANLDALTNADDDLITQTDIDELNASLAYTYGDFGVTGEKGVISQFQVGDDVEDKLTITFTQLENPEGEEINDLLNGYKFQVVAGDQSFIETSVDENTKTISIALSTYRALNTDENIQNALTGLEVNGQVLDQSNITFTVVGTGDLDSTAGTPDGQGIDAGKYRGVAGISGNGLTLQIGSNNAEEQRVTINVDDMSATALKVDGITTLTQESAAEAISFIDDAINVVSVQRAELGSLQNRLEHTIKNLDTAGENTQAAESRVRDVDMAKEIMELTKSQILQQASQAMLSQANLAPQGVLQLLR